jgi:hypothetical protein
MVAHRIGARHTLAPYFHYGFIAVLFEQAFGAQRLPDYWACADALSSGARRP